MRIWKKYVLRELLKFFSFFLCGFYLVYVLIDYSTHMQDFVLGKNLSLRKIGIYYALQFFKRGDILLPLALLIATIKVLSQFLVHRELLALVSSGLSVRKFLTPFFLFGIAISLLNLSFNEWIIPFSLNSIDKFHDAHLRHSFRGKRTDPLRILYLDDHSKLVYQYYDSGEKVLLDVVWIRNLDEIWRMRSLRMDPQHPQGLWVDHIKRNSEGLLEKIESFPSYIFTDLSWNKDLPRKGYVPFENYSPSQLLQILYSDALLSSYEKQKILTQLLFKLMMPSLGFLVVLGVAPYCVSYAKAKPQILIYSLAIFFFVAFVAFMDAAVILAENNTVVPYLAILFPFGILFIHFSRKLATLR